MGRPQILGAALDGDSGPSPFLLLCALPPATIGSATCSFMMFCLPTGPKAAEPSDPRWKQTFPLCKVVISGVCDSDGSHLAQRPDKTAMAWVSLSAVP